MTAQAHAADSIHPVDETHKPGAPRRKRDVDGNGSEQLLDERNGEAEPQACRVCQEKAPHLGVGRLLGPIPSVSNVVKVDQERHDLVTNAVNLHGIVVNRADTSVRKRAVLEVALAAQRTTLDDSEDQEAQGYAQRRQA